MSRLWRALRWLRYLPQRLAHPARRTRAVRALRRHGSAARLNFVCHGNVCRSPYAAEVARQRGLAGEIISRGFIGPDRPSPEAALRAAERRGVDLRSHRSRLIAAAEFRAGDVVFVMNGKQASAIRSLAAVPSVTVLILGDFDPLPVARREIPDPWGRSDAEFDESYARIDRCLDVVANALVG